MGLDARIGPSFLNAGLGFGGSCFPKDTTALKQLAGNSGYHFQLLNSVIEVNELQKRRVVQKLEKHLGSLVGKRIALLGLAFKPNTDDMREASSLVLSARLQAEGATVVAFDPVAEAAAAEMLPSVEMAASAEDALAGADAAILVTEWAEFAELRLGGDRRPDGEPAARRRAQLPRSRRDPGRRLRLRGHRPPDPKRARAADAGGRPRRRRGHPAASPDPDPAEAGAAARRPAVHRLHGRVARPPRRSTRS